ncbi:MAG TPA: Crp/Fnr family transcriptional regulator [Clostridiales bacterium]|jgi:CRP-like cAMP-binding protein|nr:Crp/Fnr family transcriptional regulator [Clostridiales bacterium]
MNNKDINIIKKTPLFSGMEEDEIEHMLGCLSAVGRNYRKNETILYPGDPINSIGMVISGRVLILKEDFWGNRNIINEALHGDVFAEGYACTQGVELGISAVAAEDSRVMFMEVRRVITTCSTACAYHVRLVRNLLSVLARKNLLMDEKLTHLTQRTTREKLLSYLSSESKRQVSASFEIPYNRQQLADYLSVDRSAMSSELSRMRDEGIISFEKNRFRLLI